MKTITSKKMINKGLDLKKYEEFKEKICKDLIKKQKMTKQDAEIKSDKIASMYQHHFRIYN